MESKISNVIKHLKEHESITTWEAINLYGATRLSAIIFVLRNEKGMDIKSEYESMIDRNGQTCTFAKYIYTK